MKPPPEPMKSLTLPIELIREIDDLRDAWVEHARATNPEFVCEGYTRPSRRLVLNVLVTMGAERIAKEIEVAKQRKAEEENRAKFIEEPDNG